MDMAKEYVSKILRSTAKSIERLVAKRKDIAACVEFYKETPAIVEAFQAEDKVAEARLKALRAKLAALEAALEPNLPLGKAVPKR